MIKLNGIQISKWQYAYVVFCDSDALWWQRFLKKGYRHCFLILQDKSNNYLFIDNTSKRITFNLLENYQYENIPTLCRSLNAKLIKIPVNEMMMSSNFNNSSDPIPLLTCVELIKRILGINKKSIITPWNLFKYLQTR